VVRAIRCNLARAKTRWKNRAVETDFDCPSCGKKLYLRRGRFGDLFVFGLSECNARWTFRRCSPKPRENGSAVVEGIDRMKTRECEKCQKRWSFALQRAARLGLHWLSKCRNLFRLKAQKLKSRRRITSTFAPTARSR
jgi:ssDNA-binding Zn-finger/Zn-ribbon topoisomerase 1